MKKVRRNGIFDAVLKEKIPQSDHNLSYSNDLTMEAGFLVPISLYEVVPGDVFFGGTGAFARTVPMTAPIFTDIDLEVRYFYVPFRFLWQNWRDFLTDQKKGVQYGTLQPFDGVHPFLNFSEGTTETIASWCEAGSLADYLGVPTTFDGQTPLNALYFRAYNLIWNEFFRDENLFTPAAVPTGDGNTGDDFTNYVLRRVCWRKDRFTSALPWPQKGEDVNVDTLVKLYGGSHLIDPSLVEQDGPAFVTMSTIGQEPNTKLRPYYLTGDPDGSGAAVQIKKSKDETGQPYGSGYGNIRMNTAASAGFTPLLNKDEPTYTAPLWFDPRGSLSANISVRRIRQASALQRILEKKAMAGSRYSEYILSMFGIQIPDAENGRPTYLGGGSSPIVVHPVEQTSGTSEYTETPQGNLTGKGVGAGRYHMSRPWLFNDYGILMGLAYIRPRATYYQGLRRGLFKFKRDEYYNPDYQLLGEEEISKKELNYLALDETFGYQSRFAWLKTHENEMHGNIKTDMKMWVMPHTVGQNPTLNAQFVQCQPDIENVFAYTRGDHYIMNFYNDFRARRPLYYLPILKNGQI